MLQFQTNRVTINIIYYNQHNELVHIVITTLHNYYHRSWIYAPKIFCFGDFCCIQFRGWWPSPHMFVYTQNYPIYGMYLRGDHKVRTHTYMYTGWWSTQCLDGVLFTESHLQNSVFWSQVTDCSWIRSEDWIWHSPVGGSDPMLSNQQINKNRLRSQISALIGPIKLPGLSFLMLLSPVTTPLHVFIMPKM